MAGGDIWARVGEVVGDVVEFVVVLLDSSVSGEVSLAVIVCAST